MEDMCLKYDVVRTRVDAIIKNMSEINQPNIVNNNYTGLIVDCRDMNLIPMMSPVVMNDNEQTIYGHNNIDIDKVIRDGVVSYASDVNDETSRSRAGNNPIVVKAVRLYDDSSAVVSTDDADKILAANQQSKFLDKCNVVKWPDVLYSDGKYYRFFTTGLAIRGISSWIGGSKDVSAMVLTEEDMNSPTLNPYDEWEYVRDDLSLPDELAIFCWDEPFRNNLTPAPHYNGSSTRTIDDKQYDCDQYINDIKSLAGTIIAQETYNALYDGGKLVCVQKYLIRDGKEFFVQELVIDKLTAQVPASAFAIGRKIKVYSAGNGDMKDLLAQTEQVETLGGK